jgi:hypothetical protein
MSVNDCCQIKLAVEARRLNDYCQIKFAVEARPFFAGNLIWQ